MSLRHRFLTTKNMHWQWFNALVFGMLDVDDGGPDIKDVVAEVEAMRDAALKWTAGNSAAGWSDKIGLFFNIFGHNNVNCLHLHIIDLTCTGPSFAYLAYKNCPLEDVLKVLTEEHAVLAPSAEEGLRKAVEAAAEAAEVEKKAAADALRSSSVSVEVQLEKIEERELGEIVELNVGGELLLTTPKDTIMLAPRGSLLRGLIEGGAGCDIPPIFDAEGRVYLDLPPRPLKRIIDHLRTIHCAPRDKLVHPPILEKQDEQEFWVLADLLGVRNFLMATHVGLQKLPGTEASSAPPRSDSQDIRNGCVIT